jgi:hypothetical protein
MNVIGVQAYDSNFPLLAYLSEALAYPVIEGSNRIAGFSASGPRFPVRPAQ